MALVTKYSGETLRFPSLSLTDKDGVAIPLTTFDNIFVEIYTSKANIVKFSLVARTGFGELKPELDNSFSFVVLSSQTKNFRGECFMEIKGVKDNDIVLLENNGIGITSLGIEFVDNNIKNVN